MPLVQIEIVKGRSAAKKRELLDAVHEALVAAFKIPAEDRIQRLMEHDRANLDVPSDTFTIVTISAFPGRSPEAKRELYRRIVAGLERCGVPPHDVNIVLLEPDLQNWGVRGGNAANEVDLGFELDV